MCVGPAAGRLVGVTPICRLLNSRDVATARAGRAREQQTRKQADIVGQYCVRLLASLCYLCARVCVLEVGVGKWRTNVVV